MNELKPCPCCGCDDPILTHWDEATTIRAYPGMKPSWTGRIACPECALTIQREECETEEELLADLITAWNRRHDVERIVADLRRASEDLTRNKDMDKRYAGVLLLSLASLYERRELLTEEPNATNS